MRRPAVIVLFMALAACSRPRATELTDVIADQLSAREGKALEVQALEQVQANGHHVACGFFGEPHGVSPGGPYPVMGPFVFADGRLLTEPSAELRPLVEACQAKFPSGPRPIP